MSASLTDIITSNDSEVRDTSLDAACRDQSVDQLMASCRELDRFWRESDNLYERVRALFFLYAIHRFHLPASDGLQIEGRIPYDGYRFLLARRFEEAADAFLRAQERDGPNDSISSALSSVYHHLGFQTLANQVRRSVRSVPGNQWMFRMGHPLDYPLQIRHELLAADGHRFPILHEATPVRMDLSHSAWSDIFFLGMDFPEGARVVNVSINLGLRGRDTLPRPPVNASFRVIDEPVLRLVSVDLGASADISALSEVFDYARDYLGLLKAATIASGVIPPGLEGSEQSLAAQLARLVGAGRGIELVSEVNDIPKGSRLAVSTNLLASLIAVCMRATSQTASLTGPLTERERRLVAARAILGEWLAGSGGGWQDSGGVWPGIKLIQGVPAAEQDLEFGVSRGCLLPRHTLFDTSRASRAVRDDLQASLVLVHGGMAQDVGPILEMVTEKYLLRSEAEFAGRRDAIALLDRIIAALASDDVRALGNLTTENFFGPIQTIIPWANNAYTETLVDTVRDAFGDDFWGFWMLGGMSGGGMGFIFDPSRCAEAKDFLVRIMAETKEELATALPFAMDPVVYDFSINDVGTDARLLTGKEAVMTAGYTALQSPRDQTADPENHAPSLDELKSSIGFDAGQQESIRAELRAGTIGLAQNRLPAETRIEDVRPEDVIRLTDDGGRSREQGLQALREGRVAVVSLAAGTGSRWTQGAGVVKALHPFCRLTGRYRSFIEVHLAKSRRSGSLVKLGLPHIVTTSYLTHDPIRETLERAKNFGYEASLILSRGHSVGVRMIPMEDDLRFLWEDMPQQLLDEQAQKVQESLRSALIGWARNESEGCDYTDNLPAQCLHPVGHWFEFSNLLRNGVLAQLLDDRPQLQTLMLHNIDTVGANVDPAYLGLHLRHGACLTFEVINRRIEDIGGGLARVNGRTRLVEGLAMPNEEIEFNLSFYNSMTTWIDIDNLLGVFGLKREDLRNEARVEEAARTLAAKLPTYITIKDVKKRWGHGQEDVFPVSQYEKLWGDMSALPEVDCAFAVVDRRRGQQLKDPAQLDGWLRDGSAAHIESLCDFGKR